MSNTETGADTPRTALVTGASGGLGSAICRRLAADGLDLILLYRSTSPDHLLEEFGDRVKHTAAVDLGDPASVATTLASVVEAAGDIDVLVHAAGPHIPMVHLSRVEPAQFATQMNEDANAFFNLVHALLPSLRRTAGSVTAVTTAATSRYPSRDGLSSAPKAAMEALVRAFAVEEGRFGVRFNSVGPGMLTDGMAERLISSGDLDERALDVARSNIPLRMFGTAVDIAEAVGFLASPRARFISGQKLDVDGGYGA